MNNWVSGGLLAAVITLPALSGTAWAQDNDKCSNATLKGDYAFSVVDFTTQSVVVGLGKFDGKGGFTQIDYPGDRLRTAGTLDFRMGQSGSYTVNPDCTGTQENRSQCSWRACWHLARGHRQRVCRQQWRALGSRRGRSSDPAGSDKTHARPNPLRHVEGRVGTRRLNPCSRLTGAH